jgi:wyosine [tRNA(Phe)-imidazoG37] synthetase (radical SAM superfamily)
MRGAVRALRSIRMRERAYNFSAHFRVGRSACTNDCHYCHATRRKLKLKTAYHPQREIARSRANLACESKSA